MLSAPPPIMVDIAWCESRFKQFEDDGSVRRSPINKDGLYDYGFFQIHGSHIQEATKMGYNIMTPAGNIGYALYLYRTQGTSPWLASKNCWHARDS